MNDANRSTDAPKRHAVAVWSDFCAVAPSPDLKARLKSELADLKLEIKQAIYDRRVAEAAPMLGGGVN